MKRATFPNGACLAAALALLASVGITALTPVLAFSVLYKLVVPALALAYIAYLFSCSAERVGRVTTLAAWLLFTVVAWFIEPPLTLYFALHVGAIWLIRSLYFYSSMLPALIDLALNVLSIATAFWAISHTGSTFLGIWCFFLVQALFVAIPAGLSGQPKMPGKEHPETENFERARQRAEAAIRQLFAQ